MVKTALACPEEPTGSVRLAQDYLEEFDGSVGMFWSGMREGMRLGQAFYNALNQEDRSRINGQLSDPFHKTGPDVIEDAVQFLLYS